MVRHDYIIHLVQQTNFTNGNTEALRNKEAYKEALFYDSIYSLIHSAYAVTP